MLYQTALFYQTRDVPASTSHYLVQRREIRDYISLSDSFTFSYQSINAEITNDTGLFWRGFELIAIEGL